MTSQTEPSWGLSLGARGDWEGPRLTDQSLPSQTSGDQTRPQGQQALGSSCWKPRRVLPLAPVPAPPSPRKATPPTPCPPRAAVAVGSQTPASGETGGARGKGCGLGSAWGLSYFPICGRAGGSARTGGCEREWPLNPRGWNGGGTAPASVEEGQGPVLLTVTAERDPVPAEVGRGGCWGLLAPAGPRGLQAPSPPVRPYPPASRPRAWPVSLCPGDLACHWVQEYLGLYLGHTGKQGFETAPRPPGALEHKPAQRVAGETSETTPRTPASPARRHAPPSTLSPPPPPPPARPEAQPPHAGLSSRSSQQRGGALHAG